MTDSAPIPGSHVHETGTLRRVWTAQRSRPIGRIVATRDDGHTWAANRRTSIADAESMIGQHRDDAARWIAVRDLLLREQEDESALVDELVLAGWGSIDQVVGLLADSTADHRRQVVRRILAAQKKRAES